MRVFYSLLCLNKWKFSFKKKKNYYYYYYYFPEGIKITI